MSKTNGSVKLLNKALKKEGIKSTVKQIYIDLTTCGYYNESRIEEGIMNTLTYLDWIESDITRAGAIYLMLCAWNEEMGLKYNGNEIDDRMKFINGINTFVIG
jgi:hypothetical protein